jgi:phage recombination protein Bet
MTKALAVRDEQAIERYGGFSPAVVDLVKDQVCKGATDDELSFFLMACKRLGAEPLAKHLYLVKRWDSRESRNVMQLQASIDFFRFKAASSGRYLGQTAPQWATKTGEWKDVWLEDGYPAAARVGVYIAGNPEPTWGVATWKEYVQTTKDNSVTQMWKKFAPTMIAKCAESQALRKGFPELGGLYTPEEMMQAQNGHVVEGEAREVDQSGEHLVDQALQRGYAARALPTGTPEVAPATEEQDVPKPAAGGVTVEQLEAKLDGIVSEAASLTAELGTQIPLVGAPPTGSSKAAYAAAITSQATTIVSALEAYLTGRGVAFAAPADGSASALKAHREALVALARTAAAGPSVPAEEEVPIGEEIPV